MLRLVSRLTDPEFARRTTLLDAVDVLAQPLPGEIWHDAAADPRHRRSYARQRLSFAAVQAWHIPNALLSDQFVVHDRRNLYCDASILVSRGTAADVERLSQPLLQRLQAVAEKPGYHDVVEDHANQQVLSLHNEGGGTWGHFLLQIFPKVLLFCRRFPEAKVAVPGAYAHGHSSFSQLFDLHGIGRDRLIGVDGDRQYRFGEVVLMDFMCDFRSDSIHPTALDLLDAWRPPSVPAQPAALVARLARSDRAIANAAEVDAVLARHGVAAGATGADRVEAQAAVWHGHDLVIGTLGSDLANIAFARPGTRVLALSPDWFGDGFFYNLAVMRGVAWNEIRCGEMAERRDPHRHSAFVVDPAVLDAALRRLLR